MHGGKVLLATGISRLTDDPLKAIYKLAHIQRRHSCVFVDAVLDGPGG